jgi:hypothetical protein
LIGVDIGIDCVTAELRTADHRKVIITDNVIGHPFAADGQAIIIDVAAADITNIRSSIVNTSPPSRSSGERKCIADNLSPDAGSDGIGIYIRRRSLGRSVRQPFTKSLATEL